MARSLSAGSTGLHRTFGSGGKREPLCFRNGHRALKSVLSRNASAARSFQQLHSQRFSTVGEYYACVRDLVEIIDLADIVPELRPPD